MKPPHTPSALFGNGLPSLVSWPKHTETCPKESWWVGKSREELDALAAAHQNRMRYSPHGVSSAVRFGEFMPPPIKPEKPR